MRIRLMRPDDLDAAARLVAPGAGVTTRTAFRGGRPWIDGARHLLSVDPGGCWVADEGGRVMGMAMSARRDPLWVLSAYAMEQGQDDGPGAALLEAAVAYGTGCLRGMVCTVSGSAAARLVRLAGFTLHPVMHLRGTVDRNLLPFVDGVREGTETDLELVDSVDRQLRGATHGPDQAVLRASGPLLICDLLTGSGYAYLDGPSIGLLAATRRAVAQRLLWAALARTPPRAEVLVPLLTADQEWAIDVGLAAGLYLDHDGYVAFRHMRPPAPYIPSPSFG